ncbi:MAG TPA: F0F1 ATP synthase subunit A [Pyrinomonadaceae bacterium]|nr:F0F1 ATP synthase subunit A [Pyrinomonadaceae bacterium]
MFFLFADTKAAEHGTQQTAEHAAATAEHGGAAAHHTPAIVEAINHYIGEPIYNFQMHYTKPMWDKFFGLFGTDANTVFSASPYSPENAVPWYTVMFILACIFSVIIIQFLKGRLSEDEPANGQQVLESGFISIRNLLLDNVGPHGVKYLPVVATFGVLILVSNLMGLVPGLMSPTASTSVTFALGICSFVYYNYIGIRENGLLGHLRHFAGPIPWLALLMFPIELVSNFVRPLSLGIRLFGNMFGDEQILGTISSLVAWILPVLIMPLSLFVAFMQTFIFVLLSTIYIGEVSHGDHSHDEGHGGHDEEHRQQGHAHDEGGVLTAPTHV